MKVMDIIKKQTTLIAIAVVVVAVAAIGISYAVFFEVKAGDTQVITAGNLTFSVTGINALTISSPVTTATGLKSTAISYTVKNTGNLPATYSIYIYADSTNKVGVDKIKYSTDGTTAKLLNSLASSNITLENGTTVVGYKLSTATINAGASGSANSLRIWVDEDLLTADLSNAKVSLGLCIVSEVQE